MSVGRLNDNIVFFQFCGGQCHHVTSPDLSRVWGNLRLSLAEKFPKSTMTCLEEHHSIFFWKVKVVIFDYVFVACTV